MSIQNSYLLNFAVENDLEKWIELVNVVKNKFPGLDNKEEFENYKKILIKNILRQTAICVKNNDNIIGAALFSLNSNCISWLAVHPNHRRKGIASILMDKMIKQFPKGKDVSVTTYRENDKKGIASRNLYKKYGFVESELLVEYDYPLQKFIFTNL
jgi:ribosomal protein S18 acetylase RimI-like enzyme